MKYAYFPGCSLAGAAMEYGRSTRVAAEALGMDLEEIPDWNCCGASSAHATSHLLSVSLPARNLGLAERLGLDVVAPCASCYHNLGAARAAMAADPALAGQVNSITEVPYSGKIGVRSLLQAVVEDVGLDSIRQRVTRPLAGLKVASYYGCLLVRPPELTAFDDPEDPQSLDRLVLALGGEPVPWPGKVQCCGAGHTLPRTDVVVRLTHDLVGAAREAGAEAIVTACPMCQNNLDQRQAAAETRYGDRLGLPVYYFTQLLALALGRGPQELGLTTHFVDALAPLRQRQLA